MKKRVNINRQQGKNLRIVNEETKKYKKKLARLGTEKEMKCHE